MNCAAEAARINRFAVYSADIIITHSFQNATTFFFLRLFATARVRFSFPSCTFGLGDGTSSRAGRPKTGSFHSYRKGLRLNEKRGMIDTRIG